MTSALASALSRQFGRGWPQRQLLVRGGGGGRLWSGWATDSLRQRHVVATPEQRILRGQADEVRRQLHRQHLCRSACVLRPPSSTPDAVDRELPRKLARRRMPAFDHGAWWLLSQGRPDLAQRAESVCSAPQSSDQPLKVAMRRRRRGEVTAARLPPLGTDSVVPAQRTRAHRSQMRDISSRQGVQRPNRAHQEADSAPFPTNSSADQPRHMVGGRA